MKSIKSFFVITLVALFAININAQNFHTAGQQHNTELTKVLKYLNNQTKVNKSNVESLVQKYFKAHYPSVAFVTFKDYTNPFAMLTELKKKYRISNELFDLIKKDLDYIKPHPYEIPSYCLKQSKKVNVLKSDKDKKIYLQFLSVLHHSAKFWNPKEGNGIKYIPNHASNPKAINWWKVAACDAIGAAVGVVTTAGTGSVPIGVGMSACSAINQL